MSQHPKQVTKTQASYDFTCEGCGCKGELGVPLNAHATFGCPEGCGATYIQTNHLNVPSLTCVVCPIFEDIERSPDLPGERRQA